MMEEIVLPTTLLTELVRQFGGVMVGVLGVLAAIIGVFSGKRWGARAQRRNDDAGIKHEVDSGFKATLAGMQDLIEEYRKGYEEREIHIKALSAELNRVTAELHEVRAELKHLQEVIYSKGITIPPRGGARAIGDRPHP